MPTYEYDGQRYEVNLSLNPDGSYTAVIGDARYVVRAHRETDGRWLLISEQGQTQAVICAMQDKRYVHVNGENYTLEVADGRSARRKKRGDDGDLLAQMPGKVAQVLVRDGQAVARGTTLVILEAMKMEIRVSAPSDGIVSKVLVDAGAVVERGQPLVEFHAN